MISSQRAAKFAALTPRPWFALEERHAALAIGRAVAVCSAALVAVLAPLEMTPPDRWLAAGACALALALHAALAWLPRARPERLRLTVDAGLVLDALLVWALASLSGGARSPALWLLPATTLAATLAISPRTGLKAGLLAALVVVGLQAAEGAETPVTLQTARWLGIIALVVGTAAAFSAVNERELRRRGDRLSILHEAAEGFVAAAGSEELHEIARRGAEGLLPGWRVEVLEGGGAADVEIDRDVDGVRLSVPAIARQGDEGEPRAVARIVARRPEAARRPVRLRRSRLLAVRTLAASYGAALERLELVRRLERLSTADPLTGLGNRRAFDEALAVELARARRAGAPVTLVMIDLDRFKQLNDTHGHAAGDRALVRVAEVLAAHARTEDHACRVGGEEFALVLSGADEHAGREVAERIRRAVAARRLPTGRLTVSVGVATSDGWSDPGRLAATADRRLYAAKRAGRNRTVWTDARR